MSLQTNLSLVDENDEQDVRTQRFDEVRLCDKFISSIGDFCTIKNDFIVTGQDRTGQDSKKNIHVCLYDEKVAYPICERKSKA